MGISFSGMRKKLEHENICSSLKGRIQYFATRYREFHDEEGRISILLDGREVFRSCYVDWVVKRNQAAATIRSGETPMKSGSSFVDSVDQLVLDLGGFDPYIFYDAYFQYDNQSIEASLSSPNPLVRLLAILDKRVGKRRLRTIAPSVSQQPAWLQYFYRLRLEAEGIPLLATQADETPST